MNEYERRWLNDKRQIELKKQLNEMTCQAIKPLTKREESPPPKFISTHSKPKLKVNTGLPSGIAELDLRDIAFEKELNTIANEAIANYTGVPTEKVKSHITEDMIRVHQAREQQPKIGNKYTPVDFDFEVAQPMKPILTPPQALHLQDESARLAKEVSRITLEITKTEAKQIIIRDNYDKLMAKLNAEKVGKKPSKVASINAKITKAEERYQVDQDRLSKEIERYKQEQLDRESRIAEIDNDLRVSFENRKDNADELYRVDTINQGKLEESERILNSYGLGVTRNVGESDDEYRARLIALGRIQQDESDIAGNINLENFEVGKQNLRSFFSDGSKIENILKSLNNVERFELNKKFPMIKKKYLDTYGFDSKNMNENDVVTFIKDTISNTPALPVSVVTATTAAQPVTATPIPIKVTSKDQLIEIARDNGIPVKANDTFVNIAIRIIDAGVEIPKPLQIAMRKQFRDEINAHYNQGGAGADVISAKGLASREPLRHGVHVKDYPKLIRFGKLHISPNKLYYHNILAIKNGLRKNYVGITEKKISDALASVIMKIIDGGIVKKHDLHTLTSGDKQIYDKLMMMSGLHKTHDHTFEDSAKAMKARLRLIEGEIESGNDNKELLKESHQLLHGMGRAGVISTYDAVKHYNHLKSFFE
jgi:hypothetical protein